MFGRASGVLAAVLVGAGALAVFNYVRPGGAVPATPLKPEVARVTGSAPAIAWPSGAASAVGVPELGSLGSHGDPSPQPMASVAKVMTALVVLEGHPLTLTQPGEAVTVTGEDVAEFEREKAGGQSVVPVRQGETLGERQLLEGMLIPSGNNLANLLARWDSGSIEAFVAKMNTRAAALGMKRSHFADPSGFSPQTVGTPGDLVLAGEALMARPVLAQIVSEAQVDLPVAGTVYNVDYALGRRGIVGIKTGSAPKAGACFLFAAATGVGGRQVIVFGAVMGEPTLDDAFAASEALIGSVVPGLQLVPVVSASEAVAEYRAPWGSRTGLVASKDISLVTWPGLLLHRRVDAPAASAPLADGAPAGALSAWVGTGVPQSVPLTTDGPLYAPGNFWRLTRPFTDSR